MPLSPGQTVGPYRVADKIGEGGMGEVFRAHDSRLKRDAALKVLPASSIGDPERRRRFEREAQVLATLNHPAIAQVYGVELDGSEPIIVMEFVEGATLADRIRKGPLPLDEVVAIALQLCDGLEAAHERNVIHRDLKPANIKVRPDGSIKILDFGIARVLSTDTVADTANSPTMLGGSTDAGIILGTAAYMSPEQARGRAVDKRADIWAFGCIVFEMLTGKAAFSGESTTDILADVVKKDPDWHLLPVATPDRLIDTLKRCLQKNPKDRARDIGDVRFEIEQAHRAPLAQSPATAKPARRSPAPFLLAFAAGAGIAAAILVFGPPLRTTEDAAPPAPVRSTVVLPPGTTLALGRGSSVAVAPNGERIVFAGRAAGKTQLYLRSMNAFESQPLAGTDNASNPFFSPDGRWVGFFAGEKLKKVSIDGGAPVTIADALNPRGHAWSSDDTIFVTPSNNVGVSRVPARGGKLEAVTALRQGELSHRWPMVLPDGKTLVYAVWNDVGWDVSHVSARRDGSNSPVPVVEIGGGYPRYIRDQGTRGFLVYARSEGLLAAKFDEATATLTGQAIPIVDGIVTNLSGGAHFDLSPSGTLAYVPGDFIEGSRDLQWFDRAGKPVGERISIRGLTYTWRLAGDGARLLRNSGGILSVEDIVNRQSSRVETPEAANFNSIWSRDGRTIFYARGLGQDVAIFMRPFDGTAERQLVSNKGNKSPVDVSPDNRYLLTYIVDPVSLSDIWVIDLTSGEHRPFVKTGANEDHATFSPDGRWVVYQSNESGRFELFARSFPDGAQVVRLTSDGGVSPVFSPRTGELLYKRGSDGKLMAASYSAGSSFTAAAPRLLFEAAGYDNNFAVSPDGQRVLMMPFSASELASVQINVVQNFLTELRQRVP